MRLPDTLLDELDILARFNLSTTMEGIKVHKEANAETIAAVERLYQKQLVTHRDGGYLTDLGREVATHIQTAVRILKGH